MDERTYSVAKHVVFFETDVGGLGNFFDELFAAFRHDLALPCRRVTTTVRYGIYEHPDGVSLRIGADLYQTRHLEHAVDKMLRKISYSAITSVRECLVIHAGVVCRRNECLILPAASGSGKTTLTAALVRAGWGYMSDEAAFLDLRTGLVYPFPRPLGLSAASIRRLALDLDTFDGGLDWEEGAERFVAPDRLRPGCSGGATPLRMMITPAYEPGANSRVEPIRRAEGMLAAIANSMNLESFGKSGFSELAALVRGVKSYGIRVDDLDAAVEEIQRVFEQRTADSEDTT